MLTKPALPQNAGSVTWVGPQDKFCQKSGFVHCVRLPADASTEKKVPVVVMLHGWGGNEGAMWIFARLIPPHVAIVTPRAPIDLNSQQAVWFQRQNAEAAPDSTALQASVTTLTHFLDNLPIQYPVDLNRLLLIGFSQGAIISNYLSITQTKQVLGVASLAGLAPPIPQNLLLITDLEGLPVFIAHGLQDSIIPVKAAQKSRDLYQQLGATVTYNEYTVGHKMNTQGMKDLKKWLYDVLQA